MKKLLLTFVYLPLLAISCQRSTPPAKPEQTKGNNMLKITSSAFEANQPIPQKYTCQGENINPDLKIDGVPANIKSLALILHDPDAPIEGGFTHWVMWNIPAQTSQIAENSVPEEAVQGKNGAGKNNYISPSPPTGVHRYYFYLYALDANLNLPAATDKAGLEAAMQGHIIEQGELMGTYQKE